MTSKQQSERRKIINKAFDQLSMMVFADPREEANQEICDDYIAKGRVTFHCDGTLSDGRTIPISITVGKPIRKKPSRTA